jgi:hypothetical protein
MNKMQVLVRMGLLMSLLFATANVFAEAQPATAELVKPTKVKAAEAAREKPVNPAGKRSTFRGVVAAAGGDSLTLSLTNGDSITFVVTDTTKVKVPALGRRATLADVKTGAQAMVSALQTRERAWIALYIHVFPGKLEKILRVGAVTEYVAGASITILATDGSTYAFAITSDTKITPRRWANQLGVGTLVTIGASRAVTGAQWTARGIVIHLNPDRRLTTTPMPPMATRTPGLPGMTNTPLPPTATTMPMSPTATKTAAPPEMTNTPLPPTATNTPPLPTTAPITWDGYVGPLFAAKCTMCHGEALALGGVSLATYQDALTTSKIIPGDPAGSKLVIKLQTNKPPHQLPADEMANVIAWIQAGAPEK